jgi:hypothetical protein
LSAAEFASSNDYLKVKVGERTIPAPFNGAIPEALGLLKQVKSYSASCDGIGYLQHHTVSQGLEARGVGREGRYLGTHCLMRRLQCGTQTGIPE